MKNSSFSIPYSNRYDKYEIPSSISLYSVCSGLVYHLSTTVSKSSPGLLLLNLHIPKLQLIKVEKAAGIPPH
jgi:hypothetical protein